MKAITLGDKLQFIRKDMGMSQKDFSEYLGLPQPSLSAYENNRNSPTVDVLINIANKCNISLDWLCGISSAKHTLSSLSDIADVLYALMETEDIKLDIEVHDHLPNDEETETDKWYTSITICGNDVKHEHNASLCNIIRKVSNDFADLESYTVSKEMYDLAKEKTKDYYALPLKLKKFPELSREERIKKHMNYIKKQ
ncbi:MAG: helix-turn-helix transcriptional regulator [Erysipelotrichaceae bacterium]